MANFEIPENPVYKDELRMLEPTDPAHADLFNTIFQALINNDEFLKKVQEIHTANSEIHMTGGFAPYLKTNDIVSGINLNDKQNTGFYKCSSNEIVATLINSPTKNAFFMIVGRAHGTYQEIIEYLPNPKRYMRNYYFTTGWGEWQRVYSTADKPSAAELGVLMETDPVVKGSFSQNRSGGSKIGLKSFAAGSDCKATGDYSHAEGDSTTASGGCAHAEGGSTIASSVYSHSEGAYTQAKAGAAHAEGSSTIASGDYSHAEGQYTKAEGESSHAEGDSTTASGTCAHASGAYTQALAFQFALGHHNNTTLASNSTPNGVSSGTAFVIGNGTGSVKSNACRITDDGAIIAKKAYQASGADYAERKEWLDGNPDNEDRRGYFVTMEGDKIKIASPGDFLLGVISANPCIIGNNDEGWMGQFLMDKFGDFIIEEIETVNEETGDVKKSMFYKVNPDYDPDKPYIHRESRREWDCVGMLGFLTTHDDGTCQVNGYCTVADGGVATAAEHGCRVVERINDNLIKILFR